MNGADDRLSEGSAASELPVTDDAETISAVSSGHTFETIVKVNIMPAVRDIKGARLEIVSTCVSSTGRHLAIVTRNAFVVYRTAAVQRDRQPFCMGSLANDGVICSGLDAAQLRFVCRVDREKQRWDFSWAAINDKVLALTVAGSERHYVVLISLSRETNSVAKIVGQLPQSDAIVRKLLFNGMRDELTVLAHMPQSRRERLCFYDLTKLKNETTDREQTNSEGSVDVIRPQRRDTGHRNVSSPYFKLELETRYAVDRGHGPEWYTFKTRDAKYSPDGRKLVMCTSHTWGSALVTIVAKDPRPDTSKKPWKVWGRRLITIRDLDNWDEGCLGFTGVD